MSGRAIAMGLVSLAFGLGAGVAAAGCGEDRGTVEVEGGTTATTSTTETGETTGTTETGETTGTTTTESGY